MVRFANEADFDFVKGSWKRCFDDTEKFVDWNFAHNYSPGNTVIAECGGAPASVMQLMPYKLVLGGTELNARYISGVATLPEYRGRGLVRELFSFGLSTLKEMGCDIAILIPAVEGMYEKFGYAKVCPRTLRTAESLGGGEIIKSLDNNLIKVLDKIYKKNMRGCGAYIKRSKYDWERILTDLLEISGGCVVLGGDGYALAYPKENGFEIDELFGGVLADCAPFSAPPTLYDPPS